VDLTFEKFYQVALEEFRERERAKEDPRMEEQEWGEVGCGGWVGEEPGNIGTMCVREKEGGEGREVQGEGGGGG